MKNLSTLNFKKILSLVSVLLLVLCTAACNNSTAGGNGGASGNGNNTVYSKPFTVPDNIMSEEAYRAEIDALTSDSGYSMADDAYIAKIDNLKQSLYNMITYNQGTAEYTGTAYYVSNSGSDSNDGLTPETAWATLDKVNVYKFNAGDAVLFERGGLWRGSISAQSNVTYSAYGEGYKPKIYQSFDGKALGDWVETETPNVWVLDNKLSTNDVGLVVFNDGEEYAECKFSLSELTQNYTFCFNGSYSKETKKDKKLYLYCDKGNPNDVFNAIDISYVGHATTFAGTKENITFNNLEISYGSDYFFENNSKNITVKYCTFRYMGGQFEPTEGIRYSGGGGAWQNCDTMIFEHCYFYEHFDAGTSPQYNGSEISVFKNYRVTDCLIEKAEYAFEYFQSTSVEGSKYQDFYIAYNIMSGTGSGFGDKRNASACIKGRNETESENCIIEKNIYDRSETQSVNILGYDKNGNKTTDNVFFTMRNNVYLAVRPKSTFAKVNEVKYTADQDGFNKYIQLGIEENPILKVIPKN